MTRLNGQKWWTSGGRDFAHLPQGTPQKMPQEMLQEAPRDEGPMVTFPRVDSAQELRTVMLEKLILKHLLFSGRQHIETLARGLALAVNSVEAALKRLYEQGMLDLPEACPSGYPALVFPRLNERGKIRAQHYAIENAYRGPMPVSLSQYRRVLELQSFRRDPVHVEALCSALEGVLRDSPPGTPITSVVDVGQSILRQDGSNGKPDRPLQGLGTRLGDAIAIPFAVEANGEIIKVFDPALHLPADRVEGRIGTATPVHRLLPDWDHRWAWCRRPLVILDRDRAQEGFEPLYEPDTDCYDAPIQIKANGGILLLEWGNGLVPSSPDLMARWKKASECHQERLALGGQADLQFPFDSLPIVMDVAGIRTPSATSPRIETKA